MHLFHFCLNYYNSNYVGPFESVHKISNVTLLFFNTLLYFLFQSITIISVFLISKNFKCHTYDDCTWPNGNTLFPSEFDIPSISRVFYDSPNCPKMSILYIIFFTGTNNILATFLHYKFPTSMSIVQLINSCFHCFIIILNIICKYVFWKFVFYKRY